MPRLKAWDGYNLHLTLAPSFARALFERKGDSYVKVAGQSEGAVMRQEGEYVVGEGCSADELRYWSGLWLNRRLVEEKASLLAEMHRGLGLSISPYDKHLIFVAVFLSRATSWEANVLKWCRAIFSRASTLEELLQLDFTKLGGSFQLRQLREALNKYASVTHTSDVGELRARLLGIKHVGPKLADAYLLFTGIDTSAAPVDRHALRMAARLGLPGVPPRKDLCIRYPCTRCPASGDCLRFRLTELYGPVAGWVQTAFYVHDTVFCAKRACNSCNLSNVCRHAP